jgi:hypothetical protein
MRFFKERQAKTKKNARVSPALRRAVHLPGRKAGNRPSRLMLIGTAIALSLFPLLMPKKAMAAGHPAAPPTPAVFSTVKDTHIVTKRTQDLSIEEKSSSC